jgi:SAM-dependent methyltransferase
MIEAARTKARGRCEKAGFQAPDFRVMDMLAMAGALEPGFDLVFCIGNSLVHLETDRQVGGLLADCRTLLRPGGRLVLQIINYDRVLAEGITDLPRLRDGELEFRRYYDREPGGGVVFFRTELHVTGDEGERVIRNRIPLRIVTREQLEHLVLGAGFVDLELFGGFDSSPLTPGSLPLILGAQR